MMSIFPIFRAWLSGILLIGVFCWKPWLFVVFMLLVICSIFIYMYEVVNVSVHKFHYESAFWLFIFSEIIVFGTLFFCCLYYDSVGYVNLSSPLEIPLLGCFLLLGSRVTITGFHHLLNWEYSWVLLLLTIVLGIRFMFLQVYEIGVCEIKILDSSFHASRFCTIGAHARHVLLGVIAMCFLLWFGVKNSSEYYCTIVTWYWHFVDYVWLFVYLLVYVC